MMLISVTVSAQKDVRKNIRKGNKEYKEQKFSEAADYFSKAVEGNPNSQEANYNLGNTLYRQKEWDKAIEQYNQSNALEQENPIKVSAGMHNIGNAMLQKKQLKESMEAYKMALRLNPQDDEARYNLAVVQKMIQDEEQQSDGENDQEQQEQEQDQQQNQQNQPQPPQDQEKRAEQPQEPEQMSRDNARQLLQAIEQDERETQEKVQQIKAQEREEQAEENRRRNKNW
ncbi:MAG TPA: tetratricopeptide repeat protein [Fermentimonas caenicola]|nr:MAG: tetratricopeptide repeat protein [Fermentimonas caenicola]HHU42414.1 tetratricopeptide repeat protein [Fermentimonas caenicola]